MLGGLTFMASLTASIFALVIAQRPDSSQFGFICLALIGAFGMYASVQFLRGSSMKLLAVALMLGAIIDILGMVFLPIYQASRDREGMRSQVSITDVMEDRVMIPSMPELLEPHMNTIYAGIVILLVIAAALYYLSLPATRDKFNRGVLDVIALDQSVLNRQPLLSPARVFRSSRPAIQRASPDRLSREQNAG